MIKVSVLVPVYGVEKFIERCVRSLMEQTYDNIEYIFVDDCSPDKSVQILESVLAQYNRLSVKILHNKENIGLKLEKVNIKCSLFKTFFFIFNKIF